MARLQSILLLVFSFLKKNLNSEKAVLLALSGGPDSRFLYYLLNQFRLKYGLKLHIAHVDHNWRSESTSEALKLKELVEKDGYPFHLKVLDPSKLSGNLEEACRKERLKYFEDLSKEHAFQAILMGHHADDLAETILKRLLESASLDKVLAMKEISQLGELTIWRPLLSMRKKEILAYLEELQINAFQDVTNENTAFLRARMRKKIIPELSKEFQKDVTPSLIRLGVTSDEIYHYIEAKTKHYTIVDGSLLNMNDISEILEIKHLLKKMAHSNGCKLNLHCLNEMAEKISTKTSFSLQIDAKEWKFKKGTLSVSAS